MSYVSLLVNDEFIALFIKAEHFNINKRMHISELSFGCSIVKSVRYLDSINIFLIELNNNNFFIRVTNDKINKLILLIKIIILGKEREKCNLTNKERLLYI